MIITVTFNPAVDVTLKGQQLGFNQLNRVKSLSKDAGGKGINVSKTLKQLKTNTIATGFIGQANGTYIKAELDKLAIDNNFVWIEQETRMNIKLLDEQNQLSEFNQLGPEITADELQKLEDILFTIVQPNDIVVLSGKVNPNISDDIYAKWITKLKKQQALVILDSEQALLKKGIEAKPLVIKPNKHEICEVLAMDETVDDLKVVAACKKLLNEELQLIVLTLGDQGAYYISANQVYYVPILPVAAQSSVGAGDATVAGIAYALNAHYSLEALIELANACAAGAVISEGTNPADLKMIEQLKKQVKYKKVNL